MAALLLRSWIRRHTKRRPRMRSEQGFTVTEVLVASTLSLIILAGTMGSLNDALGLNDKALLLADLGQNLRAGLNLLVRDFVNAGWGIPIGGLPIPSGAGTNPVARPGPPGTNYTFAGLLTLSAVNSGEDLGPVSNGQPTDMVSMLYADNLLTMNQRPLDAVTLVGAGARFTVNAATPITNVVNPLREGDLISLSNALGTTLMYVSTVAGQRIDCNTGDPMNLNQPNAPQGSIALMAGSGAFPPTTATRVWLVTYYLDTATDPAMPRLIRRVNNRRGEPVALVLENLQLSYDLVDGVTNPTAVKTPTAPNSSNQIRKVNIMLGGRSSERVRNTSGFLRQNLNTQVSLRSLAFIDRYR
jgi:hypothetical protein